MVLQKLNTELPRDPAGPLLGVYPQKTELAAQAKIWTPMVLAALLRTTTK